MVNKIRLKKSGGGYGFHGEEFIAYPQEELEIELHEEEKKLEKEEDELKKAKEYLIHAIENETKTSNRYNVEYEDSKSNIEGLKREYNNNARARGIHIDDYEPYKREKERIEEQTEEYRIDMNNAKKNTSNIENKIEILKIRIESSKKRIESLKERIESLKKSIESLKEEKKEDEEEKEYQNKLKRIEEEEKKGVVYDLGASGEGGSKTKRRKSKTRKSKTRKTKRKTKRYRKFY